MTTSQHTPGPWRSTKDARVYSASATEWNRTANAEAAAFIAACGANQANARLIAAAPDLLAALQFYANAEDWKDVSTGIGTYPGKAIDFGEVARAAISKATGA